MYWEYYKKLKAEQNRRQDLVNANQFDRDDMLAAINALHTAYPQYQNYFDDWRLVRITQDVKTSMGLAFKAGDITLGCKEELRNNDWYWHVFSFRNGVVTRIKYHVEYNL